MAEPSQQGGGEYPDNEDAVRRAMMADLGNDRLEDFAKDDHYRPSVHVAPSQSRSNSDWVLRGPNGDELPQMISNAWTAGVYDDEDAKMVEGLDTIADGRLHALNREHRQASRGGHGAGDRGGHHGSMRCGGGIVPQIHRMMHGIVGYDPSRPNFLDGPRHPRPRGQGQGRGRQPQGRHIQDTGSMHVSSLGGLVPPGATVRRWEPGQHGSNNDPPPLNPNWSMAGIGRAQPPLGSNASRQNIAIRSTSDWTHFGAVHGNVAPLPPMRAAPAMLSRQRPAHNTPATTAGSAGNPSNTAAASGSAPTSAGPVPLCMCGASSTAQRSTSAMPTQSGQTHGTMNNTAVPGNAQSITTTTMPTQSSQTHYTVGNTTVPGNVQSDAVVKLPPHLRMAPNVAQSSSSAIGIATSSNATAPGPAKEGVLPLHMCAASSAAQRSASDMRTHMDQSPVHSSQVPLTTVLNPSHMQPPHTGTARPLVCMPMAPKKPAPGVVNMVFAQPRALVQPDTSSKPSTSAQGVLKQGESSGSGPLIPPISTELEILFEREITKPYIDANTGEMIREPGWTYLIKLPGHDIVVWELRLDKGEVIREDVRRIFSVLQIGTQVLVRFQDFDSMPVRTTNMDFDARESCIRFKSKISEEKKRLEESMELFFPSISLKNQQPKVIDIKSLFDKPLLPRYRGARSSVVKDDEKSMNHNTTPLMVVSQEELVDTSPISSPLPPRDPRTSPHTADVEGLVYHEPVGKVESNPDNQDGRTQSEATPISPAQATDATDATAEVPRPLIQGPEETPMPDNEQADANVEVSYVTEHVEEMGCLDSIVQLSMMDFPLTLVDQIPAGVDLSKATMKYIVTVDERSYGVMHYLASNLLLALTVSGTYRQDFSAPKQAALQISLLHSLPQSQFKKLSLEDKQKAAAVVYANLRRLQTKARITYSAELILALRKNARPRPPKLDDRLKLDWGKLMVLGSREERTPSRFPHIRQESTHQSGVSHHGRLAPKQPTVPTSPSHSRYGRLTPPPDDYLQPECPGTPAKRQHESLAKENILMKQERSIKQETPNTDTKEESSQTVQSPMQGESVDDQSTEDPFVGLPLSQSENALSSGGGQSTPTQVAAPHLRGLGHSLGNKGLGGSRWA